MIDKRPWGWMLKVFDFKTAWLKLIRAKGRTSLQKHAKRDEYFAGIWKVRRNEVHRLQRGIFIELSIGDCREDDIVRIEDDFERK